MKKFLLIILLILLLQLPVFCESKTITQIGIEKIEQLESPKDPNIINIPYTQPIQKEKLNKKFAYDQTILQKKSKIINEDQKRLYYIFEKIIRANKLQYQNWRIGFNIDSENLNAYSSSSNLITINSSLYDSIYQNKNALAFIISHELAHFLLNHNQQLLEDSYMIQQLQQQIINYTNESNQQSNLATLNNIYGNYYASIGNSTSSLAYSVAIANLNAKINAIYLKEQELEIDADAEALILMARAGFDIKSSLETLEILSKVPNIYTNNSTHPTIKDRFNSINNELNLLDIEELKRQGNKNIYNSKVIDLKKSVDNNTIILLKDDKFSDCYTPYNKSNKYLVRAYRYFLEKDYSAAIDHFYYAYQYDQSNYIPALYMSYIFEYYFNTTNDKKCLKVAKKWIKKAKSIDCYNQNIIEQETDIKNLFINLKRTSKN